MNTLTSKSRIIRLFLVFLTIAALILLSLLRYNQQKQLAAISKHKELQSITELKIKQLEQWRTERLSEASFFSTSKPFAAYALAVFEGDTSENTDYRRSLQAIMSNGRYKNIYLLDNAGNTLFSVYQDIYIFDHKSRENLEDVFGAGHTHVRDFFYCLEHGEVHSEIAAPVFSPSGEVVMAMLFLTDPTEYLFPVIERWPVHSVGSEAVIVRREGDSVRLLNNLLQKSNSRMETTLPLRDSTYTETLAATGRRGMVIAKDYSGTMVLAEINKVAGSDWVLVVKTPLWNIYSELNKRSFLIGVIFLLMLVIAIGLVSRYFLQRQKVINKELETSKSELTREEMLRNNIMKFRLDMIQMSEESTAGSLLVFATDKMCNFTGSKFGFFHTLMNEGDYVDLKAWSSNMKGIYCNIDESVGDCRLKISSMWSEGLHGNRAVIHNDFNEISRKPMVEGHPHISREMVVPVKRGGKVVAIVGVANKEAPYDNNDADILVSLADIVWEVLQGNIRRDQLAKSEEKYRRITDNITDVVWIMDMDFNTTYVSPSVEKLLGETAEVHMAKSIEEKMPKESIMLMASVLREEIKKDNDPGADKMRTRMFEIEHFDANGNLVWLGINVTFLRDKDAKPIGILGVTRDISLRKQMEQELIENEETIRLLFNSTAEGILGADNDGICTFCNKSALRLLGLEDESQVVGALIHDIIHLSGKGDGGHEKSKCRVFKSMAEKVPVHVSDDYFFKSDGTPFPVEFWSYPIFRDDKVSGTVLTFLDITRRKYDQQVQHILYEIARQSMTYTRLDELLLLVKNLLSEVMDTSHLYVSLYDPNNDTFRNVLLEGGESNGLVTDGQRKVVKHIMENGVTRVMSKTELQSMSIQYGFEYDSETQCCLCAPIKDKNKGMGIIVLKSYTDPDAFNEGNAQLLEMIARELSIILQREAMINELVAAKEKAEESDRLKTAFLTNISHEIRTPMNGILGFMELLSEPDLEESQKELYLSLMHKSGSRLLDTINAIIEISKIESGQVNLNLDITDCSEIMDFHRRFFEKAAADKGVSIILEKYLTGEEAIIETDKFKLDAILTNLINNSLKFTEDGFVRFGNYREGNRLVFYVEDTGIGIPPEKIEAVFNRFVQVDSQYTRPYEGSGLGLSIVKGYIDTFGGEIFVESEPGRGSRFTFKIPYIPGK
ncbi:MAG: PAS domain S-box protein [Bacteroidia bacterium]|nr:PAS domain S-box protein [Bacteroidia bacterium]